MKKAITHLKLEQANKIKLLQLDELVVEHQRVVQAYCDWLIKKELREPDRKAGFRIWHLWKRLKKRLNI
jgi:hypothetical protein